MAENSRIEWTDHTFNPWVGCTKVSPACDHCYAESWARRTGQPGLWQGERRRTSAANWQKPLKWERDYIPGARVFCASLADVFDNQVPAEWRDDLWQLIRQTPSLDWQLLTKRPQNIVKMLPADWGSGWDNVWLGTTVENQQEAERRIPHLLSVPAKVRFLSCEPLLGPVDLTAVEHAQHGEVDALTGYLGTGLYGDYGPRLHWVICGGESGSGARPMQLEWARDLRDLCKEAGVPFFMKQIGGRRKPFPPIPDDLMVREFPNA